MRYTFWINLIVLVDYLKSYYLGDRVTDIRVVQTRWKKTALFKAIPSIESVESSSSLFILSPVGSMIHPNQQDKSFDTNYQIT